MRKGMAYLTAMVTAFSMGCRSPPLYPDSLESRVDLRQEIDVFPPPQPEQPKPRAWLGRWGAMFPRPYVNPIVEEVKKLLPNVNPVQKKELANAHEITDYAILVAGTEEHERFGQLKDQRDRNTSLISLVHIFNSLVVRGFSADNITVLYADGKPDFSGVENSEAFRQHYGDRLEKGTAKNWVTTERKLTKKMDDNDRLLLYFGAHGSTNSIAFMDIGMKPSTLDLILSDNEHANNLVITNSCFGGEYFNQMQSSGYFISGSEDYCWSDKHIEIGRFFFDAWANLQNDSNKDGYVSIREATQNAFRRYRREFDTIKPWLKEHYAKDSQDRAQQLLYLMEGKFQPKLRIR